VRDAILRAHGLSWRVGGFTIVDDVDLDISRGEFLSVIGPNGAGKSTLINLFSGVARATAGTLEFNGVDVTRLRAAPRARRGLGRTFQTSSLFTNLTVLENARLSAQASLGGSISLWRQPAKTDAATVRAYECLEEVGLLGRAHALAVNLPYGDKRKLDIALALCQRPEILLLDEPTAGVSTEDVGAFVDVIRGLHRSGRTIVMVEHLMDLIVEVSDRMAVMQDGRLIACDTPENVMALKSVQAAYLGEDLT